MRPGCEKDPLAKRRLPVEDEPEEERQPLLPTEMRRPAHGHGLLRIGNPGNKGGGAIPSELRRRMRDSLADNVEIAVEIAQDEDARDSDRLTALDFLARYGLGSRFEVGVQAEPIPEPDWDEIRADLLARHARLKPAD